MPIREYTCSNGHQFETREKMDAEPMKLCPLLTDLDQDCEAPLERKMSRPFRPRVEGEGGTPNFHGMVRDE